ncbi:MAG: hypothetical protein HC779_00325 [Phyllobacteriaceae bacterium]|nr:hypothetical protein [Phyllobacteriaceae bacterium]
MPRFFSDPASHTPEQKQAIARSEAILADIAAADTILITTPMYNFGIPSALKGWFDQVVRINRTFSYDGKGFGGLVSVKKAYVVVAYGAPGYANDGSFAAADFTAPYLKFILGFIGITDVTIIPVEGTSTDTATLEQIQQAAIAALPVPGTSIAA